MELDSLVMRAHDINNIPLLFVAARQDVLITIERVESLAAQASDSARVITVEASHLDAPDRCRAPLSHWLEEQGFHLAIMWRALRLCSC